MEVLALAFFDAPFGSEVLLDSYMERGRAALQSLPGHLGMSLWKSVADPARHILAFEYADEVSANNGLAAMTMAGLVMVEQNVSFVAPAIHTFRTIHMLGHTPRGIALGGILSVVIRGGEPGRAALLDEDLKQTFATMAEIPGFQGGCWGPKLGLEDEMVAVAVWESLEAYSRSLPPMPTYEVRAYSRIE